MHAIRQHEFGPAETLRHEEVPDPYPRAEQVRIAVEAAGRCFPLAEAAFAHEALEPRATEGRTVLVP
jgi:NADPH:quinone reductase-like Zn-dependent oxidoreductase